MRTKKQSRVVPLITLFSLMVSASAGIMVNDSAKAQSKDAGIVARRSALRRYTRDLTKLAAQGRLEVTATQMTAVPQILQILARDQQNNPVLIG